MRILLTGSRGFIGRHLLAELRQRHDVVAPSSAELNLLEAESVAHYFRSQTFDAVVHSAMAWDGDVLDAMLRMHIHLTAHRDCFGRLIYMGSGAEYGKQNPIIKASESDFGAIIPTDSYGFAKYLCSRISKDSVNIINLRLFGVYGPMEQSHRFISSAIQDARAGRAIHIRQNVRFSYLWIGDLARVVDLMLTADGARSSYNIVPPESTTLVSIAEKVKSLLGPSLPLSVDRTGMNLEYTGDSKRFRDLFPEFRFTSINTGINLMVSWHSGDQGR